jgi:SAM-dependent methyltransferase
MPSAFEIKAYYNSILPKLSTENARHRLIYQSLDSLPQGKTLDIGCGAGFTSKHLADGGRDVVAIDFSSAAIEYAQAHNSSERIHYECTDILDFKTDEKFDIICLVDVWEHLPYEDWDLTRFLNELSHAETIIYLNIPYSETLNYLKREFPHVLQPIDESKEIGDINHSFSYIDFVPFKMSLYGMQYVEYFFCKQDKFQRFMDAAFRGLRNARP